MRDTQLLNAINQINEKQEKIHETVIKTQIDVARIDSNVAGLQINRSECMRRFNENEQDIKDLGTKIDQKNNGTIYLIGGIASLIVAIIVAVIALKGH